MYVRYINYDLDNFNMETHHVGSLCGFVTVLVTMRIGLVAVTKKIPKNPAKGWKNLVWLTEVPEESSQPGGKAWC